MAEHVIISLKDLKRLFPVCQFVVYPLITSQFSRLYFRVPYTSPLPSETLGQATRPLVRLV